MNNNDLLFDEFEEIEKTIKYLIKLGYSLKQIQYVIKNMD